ncbi:MAG: AMP-binding protein [bacterium]
MASYPQKVRLAFESPVTIRQQQEMLLAAHLQQCAKSPFYAPVLKKIRLAGRKRISLDVLQDLPLASKADFEKDNLAFLAVEKTKIRDIVQSSGTTGLPTQMMYTARDLTRLAYNEAICFKGCGMTKADRVLLTCTMDRCFVAGYAYCLGTHAVGAASIRSGLNLVEGHASVIGLMQPSFIVGVPGFLRKLGRHLHERGEPPKGVRGLICIGEPLRDEWMRSTALTEEIETLWKAPAFSTYSSSEIVTSFCECSAQQGGHAAPDLGIVEIVDKRGLALPIGEVGEVVVTPLGVEGMPVIRFRTGDIGYLLDEPCSCGRRTVRLSPILGRRAQMLKVKGTTFYPATVFEVLNGIPDVTEYFLSISNEESGDGVHVTLSLSKDTPDLRRKILDALLARLRVRVNISVVDEPTIRKQVYVPQSRKPIRFFDLRK